MINMQQLNNDKYKDSKLKQQIDVTRFNEYSQDVCDDVSEGQGGASVVARRVPLEGG